MSRKSLKGVKFPGVPAMDATTLLKKDHDAVLQLFRAFAEAGSDAQARRSLYRNIRQELQTHSRVEEHVLLLPAGERVVRFRPALTVTGGELTIGVAALDRVLYRIEAGGRGATATATATATAGATAGAGAGARERGRVVAQTTKEET